MRIRNVCTKEYSYLHLGITELLSNKPAERRVYLNFGWSRKRDQKLT